MITLSTAPTYAFGDMPTKGGQCKNHIKGPTISPLLPQGIPDWDHGGGGGWGLTLSGTQLRQGPLDTAFPQRAIGVGIGERLGAGGKPSS